MPQSASTSKFSIIGGSGFNVGQHGQATESTIIVRSGNNNPKGVTAVLYNQGGFSPIVTAVAWKLVSGDDYDIYVQCGNYGNAGIRADWTGAGATFVSWGSDTPSSTKPAEVVDGLVVQNYSTSNKPTAADVGAL